MASISRICHTVSNLYDRVRGDKEDFIDENEFENKVNDLHTIGFMEVHIMDDINIYSARPNLRWADFVHIDDSIKKSILLNLIENPTTTLSKLMETVTKNYGLRHECAAQLDAILEWYTKQKKIFDEVK
jgi:hypothetical protein